MEVLINNRLVQAISTIIVFITLILVLFVFVPIGANEDGSIRIIVTDGETLYDGEIAFTEGETLFELLDEMYDLSCADMNYKSDDTCSFTSMGNHILLRIEDIESDWTSSYIAIYENGEYATQGVDSLELNDQDEFKFELKMVGE